MKKALVIGGTRFFGKRLVGHLIEQGVHVTVATRGNVKDEHMRQTDRITVDREDAKALHSAVKGKSFDIVYDQICYSPSEALAAANIFDGVTGRYIFTSTMAVYEPGELVRTESDFDPYSYPLQTGRRDDFSYGEGKRLAEAAFFQKANFPVAAVRFPVVLGPDDYTKRLTFHVERIMNRQMIGFPNPEAAMNFIHAQETGHFLAWLSKPDVAGPINACANGTIKMRELTDLIEKAAGAKGVYAPQAEKADMSPYGRPESFRMDNMKARNAGYVFSNLMDWLPELIQEEVSATA